MSQSNISENKRIFIETIENDLKATIIYNLSDEELNMKNRENLITETYSLLNQNNIVFGINQNLFKAEIRNWEKYIIAEGTAPIDGHDCIIKMYEFKDTKPEMHKNGNADFYELKLINRVKTGEWLGEKIDATKGQPGISVKNVVINAHDGKNFPLIYDKHTIRESYENGKSTIYSRIDGAVSYADNIITVSNHLEIEGDVDFKTGNIKFDGFVSIRGTVADGFSVEASKDIEINSPIGIAHVKSIISKNGSIFIKGGISAKNKVEIKAAKSVFTKFAVNACITCGETVCIGFSCVNSLIKAREIIVEAANGHIIGGDLQAEIRVCAAILGSELEKKTEIEVTGFSRDLLKERLDRVFHIISELKKEQQNIKLSMSQLTSKGELTNLQRKEYDDKFDRVLHIKSQIIEAEEERKSIASYLKAHGDGEICATKKIYANCTLIIKKNVVNIMNTTPATYFFVQNNELKKN